MSCILQHFRISSFQAIFMHPSPLSSIEKFPILLQSVVCFQEETRENVTISELSFVPTTEDDGKSITCRAENPNVTGLFLETSWKIDVVCKYFKGGPKHYASSFFCNISALGPLVSRLSGNEPGKWERFILGEVLCFLALLAFLLNFV